MNAYSFPIVGAEAERFAAQSFAKTPGARIADIAKGFVGIHGQRYGRAVANDGLDTTGLLTKVAEAIGAPLDIDPNWQSFGGDLRLAEIPLADTTIGDVLVFDFSDAPRGGGYGHQFGILTYGKSALAHDAQMVCVPHAVAIVWIAPFWGPQLRRAYRLAGIPVAGAPIPKAPAGNPIMKGFIR